MRTVIHVKQHVIRTNAKTGAKNPALTVNTYPTNTDAPDVQINGPSRVVYRPDKPRSCSAKVWIETEEEEVIALWRHESGNTLPSICSLVIN